MVINMGYDGEKKNYVTRLMYMKCDKGTQINKLNLPIDHGVNLYDLEHPFMNAGDCVSGENIVSSGRCMSSKNRDPYVFGEEILATLSQKLLHKEMTGREGCICRPHIKLPWNIVDEKHYIEGAPALTVESTAACYYGGVVEISMEIQAKGLLNDLLRSEKVELENEEEKNILEHMPETMVEKVNDFCQKHIDQDNSSPRAIELLLQEAEDIGRKIAEAEHSLDSLDFFTLSLGNIIGNYTNNRPLVIPSSALNDSGMITDSSLLYDFNIGMTNLAESDCGCTAVYNSLIHIGDTPNLTEILHYCETYYSDNRIPLEASNSLGISTTVIINYFTNEGYQTSVIVNLDDVPPESFCSSHTSNEETIISGHSNEEGKPVFEIGNTVGGGSTVNKPPYVYIYLSK